MLNSDVEYFKCKNCGNMLEIGSRCLCVGSFAEQIQVDARAVHAEVYKEAYRHEYITVYAIMIDKNKPVCIADAVAKQKARKKAVKAANAVSDFYRVYMRGDRHD